MTDRAAIDGEYSDFKIVRTRSVAQFVVEVPIEQAGEVVRLFGLPIPGKPVRVAIARLAEPAQIEAKTNGDGKRSWQELSPAQQAGIHCNDPKFWKFLREQGASFVVAAEDAAVWVRDECGVASRSELTTDHRARILWRDIDTRFQAWLRVPV